MFRQSSDARRFPVPTSGSAELVAGAAPAWSCRFRMRQPPRPMLIRIESADRDPDGIVTCLKRSLSITSNVGASVRHGFGEIWRTAPTVYEAFFLRFGSPVRLSFTLSCTSPALAFLRLVPSRPAFPHSRHFAIERPPCRA